MPPSPTTAQLLDHHGACTEATLWAERYTRLDALWHDCPRAEWMVWVLGRLDDLGYLCTERELRRFAVECTRRVESLLVDSRSREALRAAAATAERHAPNYGLAANWPDARDAARAVTRTPQWSASVSAATLAAAHLVRPRASDAAWEVSRQVLRAVAWHPQEDANAEAEERWQIELLHGLVDPRPQGVFARVWDDFVASTSGDTSDRGSAGHGGHRARSGWG